MTTIDANILKNQEHDSPEDRALSFMEALRTNSAGWVGLYFHFSKLKNYHQTPHMLEGARMVLQRYLNSHNFKIFTLSQYDVLVFIQNIGLIKIENIVMEMRKVFAGDPLAQVKTGKEGFYKTFSLSHQFGEIDQLLTQARNYHTYRVGYGDNGSLSSMSVTPFETVVKLQRTLSNADMSNFIRRQNLYIMESEKKIKKMGCEYYTSLEHIEEVIASEIRLIHDFALFKYLSVFFDTKMLLHLSKQLAHIDPAQEVHLNLNIRSLVSQEFFDFHTKIAPRRITVEIDRTDVLWDVDNFHYALDFLKSHNHRVCIDLLSGQNLPFFLHGDVECDAYKIIAHDDLFSHHKEKLQAFIEKVGAQKIIFARCESPIAIREGQALGITIFQGRYVDHLVSA